MNIASKKWAPSTPVTPTRDRPPQTQEAFSSLVYKHTDLLSHQVSPGHQIDIADVYYAVYQTRCIESADVWYDIELDSEMEHSLSFDFGTRTLQINPEPFITLARPENRREKRMYLAYLGLLLHHYVTVVHLHAPQTYDVAGWNVTLPDPYATWFDQAVSLIHHPG